MHLCSRPPYTQRTAIHSLANTGVVLISLALCADAVIGNVQEKAMKQYGAANTEMVMFSYFYGFFIVLAVCLATGELVEPFVICLTVCVRSMISLLKSLAAAV